MITNPTRQRALRGHKPTRPTPRTANSADHQAALAWRLTPRDRWIIRMLHEHRVLTSHQITALAFPSFRSGRQRLRELYQCSVLDRFQPHVTLGTAPMHYVPAPAGATILAAEHGLDIKDLGYRHDRAIGIAHSLRLAHTIGVNDWFTSLITATYAGLSQSAVSAWWSETRCARHFGDLTKPDAYGRLTTPGREIEFFLEYDLGTEALPKLANKLSGYAALAQATAITTPLLIWLPTARRETTARRLLHRTWRDLDHPHAVPIATAAADQLDPTAAHPSPADTVWLPLDPTAVPSDNRTGRRALHRLLDCWPHIPPPLTGPTSPPDPTAPTMLAPPPPTPPTTARGNSTNR